MCVYKHACMPGWTYVCTGYFLRTILSIRSLPLTWNRCSWKKCTKSCLAGIIHEEGAGSVGQRTQDQFAIPRPKSGVSDLFLCCPLLLDLVQSRDKRPEEWEERRFWRHRLQNHARGWGHWCLKGNWHTPGAPGRAGAGGMWPAKGRSSSHDQEPFTSSGNPSRTHWMEDSTARSFSCFNCKSWNKSQRSQRSSTSPTAFRITLRKWLNCDQFCN